MEEPTGGRERGRTSERRDGAFRVVTVDDFGAGRSSAAKRKAGQTTTACQMCRTRKVKCVVSEARPHDQCQPCKSARLECRWDTIDGRKRPRPRHLNSHAHLQPLNALAEASATLANLDPRLIGDYHGGQGRLQESNGGDLGAGRTENQDASIIHDTARIPGLASICETQLDPTELQGSQQFLAEFCPDESLQMSHDWPDLQNFVLGLDFVGEADGGFSTQDLNDAGHSPGQHLPRQAVAPRPRVIRLRYYRRFGPTAVIPGLRRLSVVVDPEQDNTPGLDAEHLDIDCSPSVNTASPASAASNQSKLFDKTTREPHPDIVPQILDTFFKHFGGHFPFLQPQILGGHFRSGEASSFLLNAIAALTVRFCSFEGPLTIIQEKYDVQWRRGSPFLKKAKEQLVPLLSLPAPDVLAGILVLAWAEFGDNNEAGLWMYAGMAIRMAQDLGFHRTPETDIDPNINFHDHARPSPDGKHILTDEQSTIHQQKARLVMFWSVFIMDVCVSLVTGRPPTIRRSEIEVPIPTFNDMKLAQLDFQEEVSMRNMIFPETVRFMIQFSEAVEALNQRVPNRSPERSGASDRENNLSRIRNTMLQSYNLLPPELVFNINTYRASSLGNQSGVFLTLHLFFYTFMTLLSNTHSRNARQGLHQAQSRRPSANNIFQDLRQTSHRDIDEEHQPQIAMMACQKVVQILTIAELVDSTGYLATPFTNHCFFVAGSTILQDAELLPRRDRQQTRGSFFALIAGTDYEFLYKKLQDQGKYFGAITSVASVLEQRQKALANGGEGRNQATVEVEEESGMERVVGLGDTGIVNRYTIPRLDSTYYHRGRAAI
ncbi:Fc.00g101930.m01.CDS01 [Cosmosporella sp. VM-42]